VLEQPELATDPRYLDNTDRFENRIEVDAIVTRAFGRHDASTVIARLDAARIANSRLNSVEELSVHPFLRNSAAIIGGTEISLAALPVRSGEPTPADVPSPGQHGDMIRREFSKWFSDEDR